LAKVCVSPVLMHVQNPDLKFKSENTTQKIV
jgi:hypothetical protein